MYFCVCVLIHIYIYTQTYISHNAEHLWLGPSASCSNACPFLWVVLDVDHQAKMQDMTKTCVVFPQKRSTNALEGEEFDRQRRHVGFCASLRHPHQNTTEGFCLAYAHHFTMPADYCAELHRKLVFLFVCIQYCSILLVILMT